MDEQTPEPSAPETPVKNTPIATALPVVDTSTPPSPRLVYALVALIVVLILAGGVIAWYTLNSSSITPSPVAIVTHTATQTATPGPSAKPAATASPSSSPAVTASPKASGGSTNLSQSLQAVDSALNRADSSMNSANNSPSDTQPAN